MSVISEVASMLVRNQHMLDDYALFYVEKMEMDVPPEYRNDAILFYEYLLGCETPDELLPDYPN